MQREIILVCGVTGSGKTTWARQFSKELPRLLVYDIAASFPVEYVDAHTVADLVETKPQNFRYGIYDSRDVDVLTATAFMVGNCWLVLEEISTLYAIGARIHGPLQESVLLGRQRALSMLCISQRASYFPITLRSQASRVVSFRQQEPTDIKWLQDFMGDAALKLPSMPDLKCIDWHKGDIAEYAIPFPKNNTHRIPEQVTQNDMT